MKHRIGLDLGGTNIAGGVTDECGRLLHARSVPTRSGRGFASVADDMAALVRALLADAGLSERDDVAVGVGAPGPVDPETGHIIFANNLGWRNAPLSEVLEEKLARPVYIANDADCAALGEAKVGVARDFRSAFLLTLGTGVGGSLVSNGFIYKGESGVGVEPGHMTIVHDGRLCTCGCRGCFEAYASATALIRDTVEAMNADTNTRMHALCGGDPRRADGTTAFTAAAEGDETAARVVACYTDYLASGVVSLASLFRPHAVVIGGGVSGQGDALLDPLREAVRRRMPRESLSPPEIVRATLGGDAGIIGAALLETQENPPNYLCPP